MKVWEAVRLALLQIRTEKLKSAFALIGVVLGVTFLLLVISVVEGIDRYVMEDLSAQVSGVNTVTLRRTPTAEINPSPAERRDWARRAPLTFDDAAAVEAGLSVPSVVAVESRTTRDVTAENGITVREVWITGGSPEIFDVRAWVVERGRPFTRLEANAGTPVAVLGYETARVLFGPVNPIGKTVRVEGTSYRVIGVLEEQGALLGRSLDGTLVAPIRSPIRDITAPRGIVETILVQPEDVGRTEETRDEVLEIMRTRRRLRPYQGDDFAVETAEEALSFWDRISRVLFVALPGLVGIALVVGGIVIMNIMLVSVIERTREIGIRKAIGARSRDILAQVLIESGALSALGAVLGVGLGVAMAAIVETTTPLPAAIAGRWIAAGVALGVGTGIVAGVYPAIRASAMDPVDALRHE